MNEKMILDTLNVVQVDVACTSGAVSKTETSRSGDEVFTDGSVRYMDRKLLRPFTSARQAAIRLCRTYGTKFLGGWAIPDDRLDEVRQGLEAITANFQAEKTDLETKLPRHLREWEADHPEINQYAHRFPRPAEILGGIHIQASAYKIQPRYMEGLSSGEHDGITQGIKGLAGQILAEIAQDARDAFSPDASRASARAKNVLVRAKTKLESLAFVDSSLAPVAQMIGDTLNVLPNQGPLNGQDFTIYAGLMNTLMQPKQVVATAAMLKIDNKDAAWRAFAPKDAPRPEAASPATEPANPEPPVDPTGAGDSEPEDDPSAQQGPDAPAELFKSPPAASASNWSW